MTFEPCKRKNLALARSAFLALTRSPSVWALLAGACGLSLLLVLLPLPMVDPAASAVDGCASIAFLLTLLVCTAALRVNPASDWGLYPTAAGTNICVTWLGGWVAISALLGALCVSQLIATTVFVTQRVDLLTEETVASAADFGSVYTNCLLLTLVLHAWGTGLSLWLGPLLSTVGLLLVATSASLVPTYAAQFPPLLLLPDLGALSPVGNALRGFPSPALAAYAVAHAVVPLALAATLQHIGAARGWRARA